MFQNSQQDDRLGWMGRYISGFPVRDVRKITALLRSVKGNPPEKPEDTVVMPYGITVGEYCATQFMLQTLRRQR